MKKLFLFTLLTLTSLSARTLTRINWAEHEASAKHAVIQIMNHGDTTNPFEPFKKNGEEQRGGGSGFFINENGEMLTNYHVVANARKLELMMPRVSRERFEVELVGCKPERDVALLRLTDESKKKFTTFLESVPGCNGMIQYLELAEDDELRAVQEVMALGYPLLDGLKRTIGHISGISQQHGVLYCQMTAAINQGNSGGPTLNEYGKVIGINAAGMPGTNSIGYMIPVHHIRHLIDDLRTHRVITQNFGANTQILTQNGLDALGCKEEGVLVIQVLPGSNADVMGLRIGDVVTDINGYRVDTQGLIQADWSDARVDWHDVIERSPISQPITLTVWRDHAQHELSGFIPAHSSITIDKAYPEQGHLAYRAFGGLVLQPLRLNHGVFAYDPKSGAVTAPDLLTFLHDPMLRMQDRVVVTKVYSCTQAEQEPALFAGALLEAINDLPVRTIEDVDTALAKADGDFLTIAMRDGSRATMHMPTLLREDAYLRDAHEYEVCPGLEGKVA